MTALIIFILAVLLLTGMPVSIALGLTVFTFLFGFTDIPSGQHRAEAVHRHREVRDHGDPVLHPRRQLPDPWRRGAADDPFCDLDGGHWYGGMGMAAVMACALFAAIRAARPRR